MERTAAEAINEITERLAVLEDPLSQCDYLMMEGMKRKSVPDLRQDCYRIGGCRTAIWIEARLVAGKAIFRMESDSLLVKGVFSLFDELYQKRPVKEIRENTPSFLDIISDEVIYPEIKENGLKKCYEKLATL